MGHRKDPARPRDVAPTRKIVEGRIPAKRVDFSEVGRMRDRLMEEGGALIATLKASDHCDFSPSRFSRLTLDRASRRTARLTHTSAATASAVERASRRGTRAAEEYALTYFSRVGSELFSDGGGI